ncbi:conserved hypothetical protein [Xenorhabdus bovienii str. kraussei Becker Underwood]|nr:conserved hypothetical protein [Xenorhabdus bovienii str. kraussei Becker Underwood]
MFPDFYFHMTLSNPDESDNWEGELGYVQNIFQSQIDLNDKIDVYMCGSPNMINDMTEILKKNYNLNENYIHCDVFYPNS